MTPIRNKLLAQNSGNVRSKIESLENKNLGNKKKVNPVKVLTLEKIRKKNSKKIATTKNKNDKKFNPIEIKKGNIHPIEKATKLVKPTESYTDEGHHAPTEKLKFVDVESFEPPGLTECEDMFPSRDRKVGVDRKVDIVEGKPKMKLKVTSNIHDSGSALDSSKNNESQKCNAKKNLETNYNFRGGNVNATGRLATAMTSLIFSAQETSVTNRRAGHNSSSGDKDSGHQGGDLIGQGEQEVVVKGGEGPIGEQNRNPA